MQVTIKFILIFNLFMDKWIEFYYTGYSVSRYGNRESLNKIYYY